MSIAVNDLASKLVEIMQGNGFVESHQLQGVNLKELLETVAAQVAEEGRQWDVDKLANLLTLEEVEGVAKEIRIAHESAVEMAKELVDQANIYLEHTGDKQAQIRMTYLYDRLLIGCGILIKTLGIAELFQTPDGDMEANYKGQKLLFLLHCYSMLSAVALPLLGLKWGGIVVGSFFVMMMILSLVYPLIAPPPTQLPEGKNWTELVQRGELKSVEGRRWVVEKMIEILRRGKAPLLTGPTGVGKTEVINELVRHPDMEGTTVFVMNAALLPHSCGIFNRKQILDKIRGAIGLHSDKVIVVLDELGALFRTSHGEQATHAKDIVQQLKSCLDPGPEGFRIIGITTAEEYERYILMEGDENQVPDQAFIRRFGRIRVESTSKKVTETILGIHHLHEAPQVVVEDGAFAYIAQKVAEDYEGQIVEPKGSLTILCACLDHLSQRYKSDQFREVEEKRAELRAMNVRAATSQGLAIFPSKESLESKNTLKAELQQLEAALKEQQDKAKKLHRCEDQLQKAKRVLYESALRVAKVAPIVSEEERKAFVLNGCVYNPALTNRLSSAGRVLNKALIDQVCKEVDLTPPQMAIKSDNESCGSQCSHQH